MATPIEELRSVINTIAAEADQEVDARKLAQIRRIQHALAPAVDQLRSHSEAIEALSGTGRMRANEIREALSRLTLNDGGAATVNNLTPALADKVHSLHEHSVTFLNLLNTAPGQIRRLIAKVDNLQWKDCGSWDEGRYIEDAERELRSAASILHQAENGSDGLQRELEELVNTLKQTPRLTQAQLGRPFSVKAGGKVW